MTGEMDRGASEPISEADFVGIYGDAPARFGTVDVPLNTALQMETAFCPAEGDTRTDQGTRLRYLAGSLAAAGSLRPEHAYLLGEQPEQDRTS